ncbi:MAG TPA: hypothetical protein VIK24_08050, partial [Pyrinomonadaceae bacterium]
MSSLIAIEANKVAPEKALHKKSGIPTHGSAGIVQIRPTKDLVLKYPNPTPTVVGGLFKSNLSVDRND